MKEAQHETGLQNLSHFQLLYNNPFRYTAEGQFLSIGGIYYDP